MRASASSAVAVETLADALHALQAGHKSGQTIQLLFTWARLKAAGIGYAAAIIAKARAANPGAKFQTILDAGEDAGLALAALKSGADLVRFSGTPQVAAKLSQIAAQLGVSLEIRPGIL
jgi:hypothetical protein